MSQSKKDLDSNLSASKAENEEEHASKGRLRPVRDLSKINPGDPVDFLPDEHSGTGEHVLNR